MNCEPPPSTTGPQSPADNDRTTTTTQLPPNGTVDRQLHESRTLDPLNRPNAVASPANEPYYMPIAARKRTTRRALGEEHNSSADEAAPIIRHGRGDAAQADYQSITPSPRIAARVAQQDDARQEAEREAAKVERKEGRWWSGLTEKYGSVELENKGSVARDHLALGRIRISILCTLPCGKCLMGLLVTMLWKSISTMLMTYLM